MSPDGQWIVFNIFQGPDYQSYVKKVEGGAAVKLGDGYGAGITWDASLVAEPKSHSRTNSTCMRRASASKG